MSNGMKSLSWKSSLRQETEFPATSSKVVTPAATTYSMASQVEILAVARGKRKRSIARAPTTIVARARTNRKLAVVAALPSDLLVSFA